MYLTKCYIENFGVLHQYSYEPEKGVNTICSPNGSGKSTFAAFIRAMFYGMPPTRTKKQLNEAERLKYKPWQEGMWGGYICFCVGERQYRLERSFSDREKQDTFKLFDLATGLISEDYTANIGEELFGVDKTAFGSTIYISQPEMRVEVNDSIHARLGNASMLSSDMEHYNTAVNTLENQYRQYVKTGRRGLIGELEDQINVLQNENWQLKQRYEQTKQQQSTVVPPFTGLKMSEKELQRLEWLDDYFSAGIPEKEELEKKRRNIVQEKQMIMQQSQYFKQRPQMPEQEEKPKFSIGLAIGLFLLFFAILVAAVLGGMIQISNELTINVILMAAAAAVAAVILAYVRILFHRSPKESEEKTHPKEKTNNETKKLQERLVALDTAERKLEELEQLRMEYNYLSEKEQEYERADSALKKQRKLEEATKNEQKCEEILKQITATTQQINEMKTKLAAGKTEADTISKTLTLLEQAKNEYAGAYIDNVATGFLKYLSCFHSELAKKASMNVEFGIQFDEQGANRRLDYYSSGMKDIIWFCERLALVDAIFLEERPMLILDDPFINYDDEMMQKGTELLQKIGGDIQLIYLTCRESRMI
jgi:ABC-type thiamine transport system ATPase subunit/energy-coupling factor transporter ATP-binding protein EcfA2